MGNRTSNGMGTGTSNEYVFVTRWQVEGTVEEVARTLSDAEGLKRWWPSVYLDVHQLKAGDEEGVGKEVALYTKGWLPYTLRWTFRVTESRWPHGFSIEAKGDFVGTGVWTLTQEGPWVDVVYDWRIRAEKPLLRRLSFLLKPIFEANHRWAMARGEESLKLELARRRAATPEELARIAPPPRATFTGQAPLAGVALVILAGAALACALRRRRTERRWGLRFDPDRVAHFEAAGWRAYYDRDWGRLLQLLVGINEEQFRIPFPRSWLGAYYVTRAAAAWAPKRNDPGTARRYYRKFYELARRHSGLRFDPATVADLELRYNEVHRRLARLPALPGELGLAGKEEFVRVLTGLHSALFGIPPPLARQSAELRVMANNVVDRITSKRSRDPEADWRLLEAYLRACYRSVKQALGTR